MKFVSALALGTALTFGLSAPASALVLNAGDLKITINAYDSATTGYGTKAGVACTTTAQCDVAGTKKAAKGIGSEDTWGIFSVQSITSLTTGGLIYTAGTNGEYLTGVFGGIADSFVELSGNKSLSTLALGTGGWLNLYLNNKNYTSSLGANGRLGVDGYKSITDIGGTLALSTVFGKGVLAGEPEYTYVSSYANAGVSGNGQGYLDVTGGAWKDLFDTNSQIDRNKNAHDLFFKVTYAESAGAKKAGWTVDATGDVQGNVGGEVPEPGSLALLGLGLVGLAALRRRA